MSVRTQDVLTAGEGTAPAVAAPAAVRVEGVSQVFSRGA